MALFVMNAFKEQLKELSWLDSQSRQASIEKVDAVVQFVAYPKRTFNDSYLNHLYDDVSHQQYYNATPVPLLV